ncbi:MAG: sulfurtransferase [Sulfuriferula sp.]|nr:sulfurtransferase [Sulfuriferula sp.]
MNDTLEISAASTIELINLNLACLIDIRQPFELELEGEIATAIPLPLFQFKQSLGHALNETEQELLDADLPSPQDTQHFLQLINKLHYAQDCILICMCNSGRRSLHAAQLFRELGYQRTFSLHGGYRMLQSILNPA